MQKKILFVYANFSTFVRTDFEILSEVHLVTKYHYQPVKGLLKNAWEFTRQFFYLLFNIGRFDAVFIWFADYHSFLPVLFSKIVGKKSILVVGGYDIARIPELNYGVFTSKIRGFCAAFSMKTSSLNLAVSKYVKRKIKRIAPKNNVELVYNCVNILDKQTEKIKKEDLVITVGLIDSKRSFILKGIDTFIETARQMPDYKFCIIGINKKVAEEQIINPPKNLEIIGLMKHEELTALYKKAKVYCQFSRSESFGVAVVEAISFGCVPVVTNVGGLPEILDNKSLTMNVNKKNSILQFSLILKADHHTDLEVLKTRMKDMFSINTRKSEIIKTIESS